MGAIKVEKEHLQTEDAASKGMIGEFSEGRAQRMKPHMPGRNKANFKAELEKTEELEAPQHPEKQAWGRAVDKSTG